MAHQTKSESLVPHVVNLALDVADRGQSTAVAVLNDARVELRAAVEHGIDFAEKLATAAFRFSRKTVTRVDEVASETLTSLELVLGQAVKSARETSRAAAELATTTVAKVTARDNAPVASA